MSLYDALISASKNNKVLTGFKKVANRKNPSQIRVAQNQKNLEIPKKKIDNDEKEEVQERPQEVRTNEYVKTFKFPKFSLINEVNFEDIEPEKVEFPKRKRSDKSNESQPVHSIPKNGQINQNNLTKNGQFQLPNIRMPQVQPNIPPDTQINDITFNTLVFLSNQNNENHPFALSRQSSLSRSMTPEKPTINEDVLNFNFPIVNENTEIIIPSEENGSEKEENEGKCMVKRQDSWKTAIPVMPEFHLVMDDKVSTRAKLDFSHSSTAENLFLINPNPKDIELIHHPVLDTEKLIGKHLHVSFVKKQEAKIDDFPCLQLNTMEELSGNDGKLVLIEHTLEDPPFVQNVGMCSRLVRYFHKKTDDDSPDAFDSLTYCINSSKISPFRGIIEKSTDVYGLSTDMFDCPLGKHEGDPRDFLLVRNLDDPTKFIIRRIDEFYCAGLVEARKQVFTPRSDPVNKFLNEFILAIIINIFRGTDRIPARKSIKTTALIREFFPDQTENNIRTILKKVADNHKVNGVSRWVPKRNINLRTAFDNARIYASPEDVCSYQSMLAGLSKLRKRGVNMFTSNAKIKKAIKQITGPVEIKIATMIEKELMKTPWARTKKFLEVFYDGKYETEEDKDHHKVMTKVQRAIYNTGCDWRKLDMGQLAEMMRYYSFSEKEIANTGRHDRVRKLRMIIDEKAKNGMTDKYVELFSRINENTRAYKIEKFKEIYNSTFKTNLIIINSKIERDELNNEAIFDDIDIQESDDEEEEENEASAENDGKKKDAESSNPKLKPNGVFVHKFDVDWSELGFGDYPMRRASKVILTKLENNAVVSTVSWIRSPQQIASLEKLPDVAIGETKISGYKDLEYNFLLQKKKELESKIKYARTAKRRKDGNMIQSYIKQNVLLISESTGKELTFDLSKSFVDRIVSASNNYQKFIGNNNEPTKKKVVGKRKQDKESDDDNDDDNDDETPETNPIIGLNDAFMKIINKLIASGDFQCFASKNKHPFFKDLKVDLLVMKERAENRYYKTIQELCDDVKSIREYCKNSKDQNGFNHVGKKLTKVFIELINENKSRLKSFEKGIDPSLRN